jgi:hypothetical protein
MEAFLAGVNGRGPVTVSGEATTARGRSVCLVHAARGGSPPFRVLFYAQQHGDEVSGKDALLYLLRDVACNPGLLPPDVDLWALPMVNPAGRSTAWRAACAPTWPWTVVLVEVDGQEPTRLVFEQRIRAHDVPASEVRQDGRWQRGRSWAVTTGRRLALSRGRLPSQRIRR